MSSTQRSRLPDGASDRDPLAVAYAYLNRRERTIAETRARLERAGFAAAEIAETLTQLGDLGYLDDGRYARVFAEDKRALESWGAERIGRALAARGIAPELVEAALLEAGDEGGAGGADERARALSLVRRRFGQDPPADLRQRQRALGLLVRKGYDSETAYDVVRAWGADSG